jgi:hypothetical protein
VNIEMERTAHDYERAAENTRRRLSSTLDELAANLTPGRMLDEVLSYARAGGGEFLKGLGKAASANPVPTLLIGVGAAMFLSGKGRVGSTTNGEAHGAHTDGSSAFGTAGESGTSTLKSAGIAVREGVAAVGSGIAHKVSAAASGLRSGVSSAGATVSRAAAGIADEATSTLSNAREAVQGAGSAVGEAASDLADGMSDYAARARDGAADRGRKAIDQSSRLLNDLRSRGSDFAHEQPLIVAAIGIALGAAVAALLPRTQTEDSLMGEASDALKGAVGDAAGAQYALAKTAAENVATEAKASADRHGLSAAGAAEALRTMTDKVVSPGASSSETPPAGG